MVHHYTSHICVANRNILSSAYNSVWFFISFNCQKGVRTANFLFGIANKSEVLMVDPKLALCNLAKGRLGLLEVYLRKYLSVISCNNCSLDYLQSLIACSQNHHGPQNDHCIFSNSCRGLESERNHLTNTSWPQIFKPLSHQHRTRSQTTINTLTIIPLRTRSASLRWTKPSV